MSFSITVQPGGHTFTVEENENILNAALQQGVNLPYGCRNGLCGKCKGRILKGEVDYADNVTKALSDEERLAGIALLCQAQPVSNITIEAHLVGSGDEIEVKKLPCRVQSKKLLCHDVMELRLKVPATERLAFLAGQYIDILLSDGRKRSFSLANAPHDDEVLLLHIRHVPGGEFTDFVFNEMAEKAILRIEGPLGGFYYREDSKGPVILMAGGTGFAPIKAIIEHCIAEKSKRPMHLYWGVRAKQDLYMAELAQSWVAKNDNISFTPVLSSPEQSDSWQGRTGWVHEAVLADFVDLSAFEVYACGPPDMVNAGKNAFVQQGLDEARYFSDAFEYQSAKPVA